MSNRSPDRSPPYRHFWAVGLVVGAAYWVLESAIDAFVFSEASFYDRLIRPDPNEVWMRFLVFLLLVAFGGYAQRWLSQRHVATSELTWSEDRFQSLAEAAADAIITINERSTILYANPAAYRLFGYDPDTLLNESLTRLIPAILRAPHLAGLKHYLRSGKRHVSWDHFEVNGLHRSGREFPLEVSFGEQRQDGRRTFTGIVRDITQRKEAEAALRESEERLRLTLNAVSGGGWDWNVVTGEVFYSDSWLESLGYAREEVEPHISFWERIVHPDDMPGVQEVLQDHFEGRTDYYECENRLRMRSGAYRWNLDRGRVVARDAGGKPLRMVGTDTDISDRRRAEEALRESERTLSTLMSNLPGMAYRCRNDRDWTMEFASEGCAELTGYRPEDLVDNRTVAYADLIHPEDRQPVWDRVQEAVGRRVPFRLTYRITTADGALKWVWEQGCGVFSPTGELEALEGFTTDITERTSAHEALRRAHEELETRVRERTADLSEANRRLKQEIAERKRAEQRIRRQALVFENMFDAVILTDLEHRIIEINPSAEKMFGYCREELIGCNPEILNPPGMGEEITRRIVEGIEEAGSWSGEIPIVRADGMEGICEASILPLNDEDGRPVALVSLNRDITARKRDEKEKASLGAQLRVAQKMEAVGTLASGIAHDFDNLITAIFAYTDLARTTLPDDHPAARNLDKVEQAARQARNVTSALLTFSHRSVLSKSPVNLSRTVDETLRLLGPLLPANIELERETAANGNMWVQADAGQLPQLMMNLANNARDAMPAGGRLRVAVCEAKQDGRGKPNTDPPPARARIIIEDSGSGMTEEVSARVFEPFFTTKPRGQGTGLGMSMVLGIVQDLGGEIDVTSRLGRGTRVTVTLPCCDPPADPRECESIGAGDSARGEPILVVEANHHIRSIMISALRSEGFDVIPASNTRDALEAIRGPARAVRLLIVDLDSMDDRALERLGEMRSIRADLHVLCLAGTLSINLDRYGMGGDHILRKPFRVSELASTVSRVLATV